MSDDFPDLPGDRRIHGRRDRFRVECQPHTRACAANARQSRSFTAAAAGHPDPAGSRCGSRSRPIPSAMSVDAASQADAGFGTTRWTQVLAARTESPAARAMASLVLAGEPKAR